MEYYIIHLASWASYGSVNKRDHFAGTERVTGTNEDITQDNMNNSSIISFQEETNDGNVNKDGHNSTEKKFENNINGRVEETFGNDSNKAYFQSNIQNQSDEISTQNVMKNVNNVIEIEHNNKGEGYSNKTLIRQMSEAVDNSHYVRREGDILIPEYYSDEYPDEESLSNGDVSLGSIPYFPYWKVIQKYTNMSNNQEMNTISSTTLKTNYVPEISPNIPENLTAPLSNTTGTM